MSTTIINPKESSGNGSSGGAGVVIGAALVILVLVVVIIFTLPYIRQQVSALRSPGNPTINVQLPSPTLPTADTSATPTLTK